MQRVRSLESLSGWIPTVVGMIGVAYGVIGLRGMNQAGGRNLALAAPGRRVLPVVALNVGGLALILIGSRLHGHWFIRVVRHSPAQSIMIAGEVSCQPLWVGVQQEHAQEDDAITEVLNTTSY